MDSNYGYNSGSQEEHVSDIIVKAGTRGKFFDLRNNLIPANQNDYAMIHGIGGAKHAPRSGIRAVITDYSGANSVTVSANLSPDVVVMLLEVCKQCLAVAGNAAAHPQQESKVRALANQIALSSELPRNGTGIYYAVAVKHLAALANEDVSADTRATLEAIRKSNQLPPDANTGELYLAVSQSLVSKLVDSVVAAEATGAVTTNKGGMDYVYKQDRANVYKLTPDGYCPVSLVQITRSGMRGNQVSRQPWTIKISNFEAKVTQQANKTSSYIASTARNQKDAFISITDAEMFRCMYRASRFVELWEYAVCIPLVKEGVRRKEAERRQRG